MIISSPIFAHLLSVLTAKTLATSQDRVEHDNDWLSILHENADDFSLDFLHSLSTSDEQRLYKHVLSNYDKSVRPVFNASHVVDVFMGLTLTHIQNIDERNQVLSLNVWVEQYWHDERISWNPAGFGNLTKLSISTKKLWIPDIVLYNNARDFSRGFVEVNLHVTNGGDIQYAPPAKVYSICRLDVRFFPFDDQFCQMEFRSWIYDLRQLNLQIMERYDGKTPFTKDSFTENGEWEIVNNRTIRYITGEKERFSVVVFELHLRRRMLYFMYNIIAPCVMLSILTMMQFMLPCESGEKVTLGLTVLLAYSVFSFNIAESMPETSDVIPLIAIYLMCIMGISAISVGLSVLILNVRHRVDKSLCVPAWLSYVGFSLIGRLFAWQEVLQNKRKGKKRSHYLDYLDVNQETDAVARGLMTKVKEEDEADELVAEWTLLSHVLDRFFFFFVLLLNASATLGLLVLAPRFSYGMFSMEHKQ